MEMYLRPMSSREIAKELGMNVNTVAAALSRIPNLERRNCSDAQKLAFLHGKKPPMTWLGKKQPDWLVEKRVAKIRGENHYLWNGGTFRRHYRNVVRKEKCESCGSKINLGIHHKNFDHYDNKPENLQVLCLHCHLSLHKSEYWKAKREGRTPPCSTAPHHWKKNDT